MSKRSSKPKKSRLGLWTGLLVAALVVAYVGVLELSRPHVSGDRLRFDTFVKLASQGHIRHAEFLDEDAYVVGRYVPRSPSAGGGGPAQLGASGGDHGHQLGELAPGDVVPDPVPGVTRAFNAPLLRGSQSQVLQLLLRQNIPTTIDQQVGKRVASLASFLLPGLIMVVLFVYLILSYRRGTGLFGVRSGARRITGEEAVARFTDVAGQDAAVAELREVKEFLSDPSRFAALGAQVPKGLLLYGPPGCGKTLLAKALAGEAGASFYSISGSDFVELYVGVGAARVRDLFAQARENAPSIVFIDELDSIGRARGTGGAMGAHGEQEQALNQVLAEMDGFSPSDGIIVVAATNRPDILDQALLRPGRFDRTIGLERPDESDRLAILSLHARTKQLGPDVDLASLASRAIGFTGADLASVMNEGALLAARAHKQVISQEELDAALQRILEAPERQRRLSMKDRTIARRHGGTARVTFAEVAGVDDALVELAEVREYLMDPDRFAAMGAQVPRGILLSGPPGCGKTLLARAVAGEANAAFYSVAGSEFVEVFVGEGASRVRELFAEARSVSPAIVFIDEIDAIGASRGVSTSNHREVEQTLNQILVELDGFEPRTAVIVIAATNRPDILDPALVRPGRFDRHITMTPPDSAGRRAILDIHVRDKTLAPDVDLDRVAALARGFSGADLANVVNEAALLAARRGHTEISMALVEDSIDRAVMGVASRGTILTEGERRVVAYHESGHALVALALGGAGVPHKLTILAHGDAVGHCAVIESHDRVLRSQSELIDHIAALLAGRVAEEIVFGDRASGAAADLQRATGLARRMVCELGMSDALGPMAYSDGRGGESSGRSDEEARIIYAETRRLLGQGHQRAHEVLAASRPALDRVAAALLARESISAPELMELAAPVSVRAPSNAQASGR
ncbi:MAG TPA: AAA family ATPase [Acidimicrobiales bacterium]|nr:AAA family ATPase [Acidimicrobiales bacterium]